MNKLISLFILFFILKTCTAQELEKARFFIYPETSVLSINNSTYSIDSSAFPLVLQLPEGSYPLQIWSPKYDVIRDTLVVKKNGSNTYKKRLVVLSPEFKSYKKELTNYTNQRFKNNLLKIGLPTVNLLALWLAYDGGSIRKISDSKEKVNFHRNAFINSVSPSIIASERDNFEKSLEKYNSQRRMLRNKRIVGFSIVALSSFFSYKIIKKSNKNKPTKKPTYAPKNPLVFEYLELNIFSNSGVTLHFNF